MIEGKTNSGFEFSFDEKVLQDWELQKRLGRLEVIGRKIDEDKESATSADVLEAMEAYEWLLGRILGGTEALFEHIRKQNDGIVPVTAVVNEWKDIARANKVKNS